MLKKIISYLTLVCSLSACASDPMFSVLDKAERKHNENRRQKLLIMMDLEDIFSDPLARALAKAAGKGDVKTIRQLVASGVDVKAQGRSKGTPLYWAIHKENLAGFEELLKLGATPNVRFDDTGTVMHWAARLKDSRFLQLALAYGGDPNLKGGMFEASPIFDTIELQGKTIPKNYYLLIDAGVDINSKTKSGSTLLSQAAGRERYDVVLDLLNRGAEFRDVSRLGRVLLFDWLDEHEQVIPKDDPVYLQKKKVEQWLRERGVDYSLITPGNTVR